MTADLGRASGGSFDEDPPESEIGLDDCVGRAPSKGWVGTTIDTPQLVIGVGGIC